MYWNNDAIKKIEKDLEFDADYYFSDGQKRKIINELKEEGILKRLLDEGTAGARTSEEQLIHDMFYNSRCFLWVLSEYFKELNVFDLFNSEYIRKMTLILFLKKYNLNQVYEKAISWKREGVDLKQHSMFGEYENLDLCDPLVYSGIYKADFYFDDKFLCSDTVHLSCMGERHYDNQKMYKVDFYDMIYRSDNLADALINKLIKEQEFGFLEQVANRHLQTTNRLEKLTQEYKKDIAMIEKLEKLIQEYKNEIARLKNSTNDVTDNEANKESSDEMQLTMF